MTATARRVFVVVADLDRNDSPPWCRHAGRSVNAIRDENPRRRSPRGKNQRVVFAGIELAEARVEVAADRRESRAGKKA